MAEIDPGQPMFGEPPKVLAFKGEQAVTSALMELVEGTKNTLGYVVGHKEASIAEVPAPNPMAPETTTSPVRVMKTFIENENIKFQELNLFEVGVIPPELKAVMIAVRSTISPIAKWNLRAYWEKQGRILLLIDPAAKTPKLHAFLHELGVKVNDDRLMGFAKTGIQEVALVRDVQGVFLGESPITKRLADARAIFPGGTSSLTLEPERVRAANIRLQPLVRAEKGYWAETDYHSDDQAKFQANALQNGEALHTLAVSMRKAEAATNASRTIHADGV